MNILANRTVVITSIELLYLREFDTNCFCLYLVHAVHIYKNSDVFSPNVQIYLV